MLCLQSCNFVYKSVCTHIQNYLKGHYAVFISLAEQHQSYWNGYMTSFGLNGDRLRTIKVHGDNGRIPLNNKLNTMYLYM